VSDDTDLRPDGGNLVQGLDHVVVKTDAPVRALPPDLARIMCAVDQIGRPAEVHRVGPKRIVRPRRHVFQVRIAFDHAGGRRPVRANTFAHDTCVAAFGQLVAARD